MRSNSFPFANEWKNKGAKVPIFTKIYKKTNPEGLVSHSFTSF